MSVELNAEQVARMNEMRTAFDGVRDIYVMLVEEYLSKHIELTAKDLLITELRQAVSEARELISDAGDVSCEPFTSNANKWLDTYDKV